LHQADGFTRLTPTGEITPLEDRLSDRELTYNASRMPTVSVDIYTAWRRLLYRGYRFTVPRI
jgi:hypothetical protein